MGWVFSLLKKVAVRKCRLESVIEITGTSLEAESDESTDESDESADEEQEPDIGGYSPVPGEYFNENGDLVSVDLQIYGDGNEALISADGLTSYSFDHETGLLVNPLATGAAESVCPSCYLIGGGSVKFGWGAIKGLKNTGGLSVQFGNNANQVSHAFRHTDKVGLSRGSVQSAISRDLSQNRHLLRAGSNTRSINVGGIDLTFNAHRLSNGTVNVGRITPPGP